ncbi:MAG: hypothetical protein L0Y58_20850 [Verrucomicrobia subdivision 3 bacterium]|nr:hypothetical protein [Limisphaerales bacterium]
MSAQEIIEQIKVLPPEGKAEVLEYLRSLPLEQRSIRFAKPEAAKQAGDEVLKQYDSVFRELAK